jgi:UDP-GlcNAc:undecaprenyl-phosphate GlcNAc-1-phosphate transferase
MNPVDFAITLLHHPRIPDWLILGCVAVPLALAWALTGRFIRWAVPLGLIDFPADRKVHNHPTPKGGGLAIFLAVWLSFICLWLIGPLAVPTAVSWLNPNVVLRWPAPWDPPWLLAMVLVAVGLLDDFRSLPWQFRIGVHTAVAVAAVTWCVPLETNWVRAAAVFWLVAMINALNMLDNMDALAGGVSWVATSCLVAAMSFLWNTWTNLLVAPSLPYLMLLGALLGFLRFNRPPARIFMGDAGSTFLGFMIGFGTLQVAFDPKAPPWGWLVSLCICAVPVYDQTSVVLLRLGQGRSPFHADKQHLSHRLVARGLSSVAAVRVIHLLALVSGAAGLLLYAVSSWTGALLIAGTVAAGWLGLALFEFVVSPVPTTVPASGVASAPRAEESCHEQAP